MNIFSFSQIPDAFLGKLIPTNWWNGSNISRVFGRNPTNTSEFIQAHILLANEAKTIGNLIYIDCEALYSLDLSLEDNIARVYACIVAAKNVAPAIRFAMYGPPLLFNREQFAILTNDIRNWFAAWSQVMKLIDLIDCPGYLLGLIWVDRDLLFIDNYIKIIRTLYPNKDITISFWGNFHTAWNPIAPLPIDVTNKYIKELKKHKCVLTNFDAEEDRDMDLINGLLI